MNRFAVLNTLNVEKADVDKVQDRVSRREVKLIPRSQIRSPSISYRHLIPLLKRYTFSKVNTNINTFVCSTPVVCDENGYNSDDEPDPVVWCIEKVKESREEHFDDYEYDNLIIDDYNDYNDY
jgi:hypothetical protein